MEENINYNEEPVFYCAHCLSLRIRSAGLPSLLYCDSCSCTDVEEANIEEWQEKFENKYGFNFLTGKIVNK
jgi:Fe2+ or Zn2+ uptake regulation protein